MDVALRPYAGSQLHRLCVVWEESGEIVGFAISDDGDLSEFVRPHLLDTRAEDAFHSAVDQWADGAHPGAVRYASDLDATAVKRLEAVGYRQTGDPIVAFRRRLGTDLEAPRHRVRALAASEDPSGRASITHAAFKVDRPLEAYIVDYGRFMRSPAYPEGWDLLAEDDGAAAACGIAWPDPVSGAGNFEPVATRPELERRGFASAVMREGLRRLRDAGMTWAIVRTPSSNAGARALYRSLGFEDWHRLLVFGRETATAGSAT